MATKTKTLTIGEKDELTAQAREIEMQRDRVANAVASFKKAIPDVQSRIDKFSGIRKTADALHKLAESIPADTATSILRGTGDQRGSAAILTQTVPCARRHLTWIAGTLAKMAEGRVEELTEVLARAKAKLAEDEATLKRVQADLDRALEALS